MLFKAGIFVGELSGMMATAVAAEPAPAQEERESEGAPVPGDDLPLEASGLSRSEIEILQDLRHRRAELDEREKEAALREQLLAATERRIDKKIAELGEIEEKIAALVAGHEEREDAKIASVVEVYQKMKPKDAAPIFQRLDLTIQTAVAIRMKEAKMAAVLAEMDPEAAKLLTTELATRTQLPADLRASAKPSAGNSPP